MNGRYNTVQNIARKAYADGDMAHTKPEDVNDSGDTLFSFIMSELDEERMPKTEALRRMERARDDINSVIRALETP
jgi:hypothetical protein